ncbi:MAG: hypothetical protein ACFFDF_11030 [Candidatus Odinarchaeota archaeon]
MPTKNRADQIPDEYIKNLIERTYEDLIRITIDSKSRLTYQVLGVFIMSHSAKMTNAVKELISINSRWEDEENQLYNEKDKAERYHYLSQFREIISSYKEGNKVTIFYESTVDIIVRLREQDIITSNYPLISPLRGFRLIIVLNKWLLKCTHLFPKIDKLNSHILISNLE